MKKILLVCLVALMSSSFSFSKKNDLIEELKLTPAKRASGQVVKFEDVEIFSCKNLPNRQYLFNKKQNDVCLIASQRDASHISAKLAGSYWDKDMIWFEKCPSQWMDYKFCDPDKLRKF